MQHRLSAGSGSRLCCVGHAHCVGLRWHLVHASVCLVCIAWVAIIDGFGLISSGQWRCRVCNITRLLWQNHSCQGWQPDGRSGPLMAHNECLMCVTAIRTSVSRSNEQDPHQPASGVSTCCPAHSSVTVSMLKCTAHHRAQRLLLAHNSQCDVATACSPTAQAAAGPAVNRCLVKDYT